MFGERRAGLPSQLPHVTSPSPSVGVAFLTVVGKAPKSGQGTAKMPYDFCDAHRSYH